MHEAGLDRARWDVESDRDFRDAQFFEVEQGDRRTLAWGQGAHHLLELELIGPAGLAELVRRDLGFCREI